MVGRGFSAASAGAALAAEARAGRLNSAATPAEVSNACRFEYLDHTADVQIHAWGNSLEAALSASVEAMFGYMTDLSTVRDDGREEPRSVRASGHDLHSLVYSLLDEFLFLFCTEGFVCCAGGVRIKEGSVDREGWTVVAEARGEPFDISRHPQGTEVKAITYSAMQVHEGDAQATGSVPRRSECDVFVVLDI
jgi:SHS2 domain-containing protein